MNKMNNYQSELFNFVVINEKDTTYKGFIGDEVYFEKKSKTGAGSTIIILIFILILLATFPIGALGLIIVWIISAITGGTNKITIKQNNKGLIISSVNLSNSVKNKFNTYIKNKHETI